MSEKLDDSALNNYKVNDLVRYGSDGVCRITEITEREFRGKKIRYYVLAPVFNQNSTIFIPTDNDALVSRMRYAMSADEITDIIKSVPDTDCIWVDNENERKLLFKEIIHNGNSTELVRLIKTLYLHQEKQKSIGKKMHMADERFFHDAERLLYDEFAVALGISPDDVIPHIQQLMES